MNIDRTAREMSVIGVDVSLEHPDIRRLPCGTSMRLSDDRKGHDKPAALAREKKAPVGFEAAGVEKARRRGRPRSPVPPPKQIEHYGLACGKDAETDKDDAKLIALFMRFRPDAGRELPSGALRELRAHVAFRAQLVEIRKTLKNEIAARKRQGLADMFDDDAGEIPELCNRKIDKIGKQIRQNVTSDAILRRMAVSLSSIPGIGFVAAPTLIAEMPELGLISNRKASALAGLVPYARDSGKKKGKRCISGGRDCLRTVPAGRRSLPSGRTKFRGSSRSGRGRRKALRGRAIAVARKLVVFAAQMIRNGAGSRREREGVGRIRIRRDDGRDGRRQGEARRRLQSSRRRLRRRGDRTRSLGAERIFAQPRLEACRPFREDARVDVQGRLRSRSSRAEEDLRSRLSGRVWTPERVANRFGRRPNRDTTGWVVPVRRADICALPASHNIYTVARELAIAREFSRPSLRLKCGKCSGVC